VSMAVVERVIPATPERIFTVLADGWTYSDWVVGAAHIRDVDWRWPDPGTRLHHKSGIWPVLLNDKTEVVVSDRPRELVLRAHLWPWGEFTIIVTLEPLGEDRTKVRLQEDFAAGPLHWFRNKANDLTLHYRNKEALLRLSDLATHRYPDAGQCSVL
jgi:Polyketide cyclase / dehydrase and lipid transport